MAGAASAGLTAVACWTIAAPERFSPLDIRE